MEVSDIKSIMFNPNKNNKPKQIEQSKKEKNRKRVVSENWKFDLNYYEYENQMKIIVDIKNNNLTYNDNVSKIALQEINKKIYGYKQQDIIKKLFDETRFLNLHSVIDKMIQCKLKCYYCSSEMNVLYDISREAKQWSVDRIDNDLGHNLDNFYLACLECNLKRRRRSDDKFLFTKQLKLIKTDNKNS